MPTKTTSKKAPAKKQVAAKKAAPAKKASAKKTAPKKVVTKKASDKQTTGKKSMPKASDKESFWVSNGAILNDLATLADALDAMDKAVFAYHVSKEKNDFADWVEVVLGDKACAAALRKSKTPKTAKTVVVRHVKLYQV